MDSINPGVHMSCQLATTLYRVPGSPSERRNNTAQSQRLSSPPVYNDLITLVAIVANVKSHHPGYEPRNSRNAEGREPGG